MNRKSWRRRLRRIAIAVAVLTACAGEKTSRGETAGAPHQLAASTTRAASPTSPAIAPSDLSLSPRDYVEAGMPPVDRAWTSSDMRKAAAVLGAMAETQPSHLPRLHSRRSREVFARITSTETLRRFSQSSGPRRQQLPMMIEYYEATAQVLKAYLVAFSRKAVADSDVIAVMGKLLRTNLVAGDILTKFVSTLDKKDPSYANRMAGWEQSRAGLATVITGGLITLSERNVYRLQERVRLVGYLDETLPVLLPSLTPEARAATLRRMESMLKDPALKELVPSLSPLHEKLKPLATPK